MVSLDNSVLARMEKGGKRYELLVDPDLVDPLALGLAQHVHLRPISSRLVGLTA